MTGERAILVLDDDPDVALAARFALAELAGRVDGATSLHDLEALLNGRPYDAVLLDMNFVAGDSSGRAGLDGLARTRAADPAVAVVLMTAYGGVSLAVEALKRGASDFVLKPWKNERLAEAMTAATILTRSRRASQRHTLDDLEREAIQEALARHGGNISKAAEALGVTRPALYRKIEKHGL
jgi:two-component system, response regulator RegA